MAGKARRCSTLIRTIVRENARLNDNMGLILDNEKERESTWGQIFSEGIARSVSSIDGFSLPRIYTCFFSLVARKMNARAADSLNQIGINGTDRDIA